MIQLNNIGFPSIVTLVVNDHFIREGHLWQLFQWPGQVVTPDSIAWKVISKLNFTKILVYSSALQYKKVQSSIEKFHWSKILRTKNFSFNSNIWIPLESVNQFLYFFLCLKVILTMEHYIKVLSISFIWKFSLFWSWQIALWNLGQPAPASFFCLQQAHGHHVWDIYVID